MSSADQSSTPTNPVQYVSRVPDLKVPAEWNSNIPSHLLADVDPATRWIMEELSKNTQATQFAIHAVLEQNNHLKNLNGKTFKTEKGLSEAKDTLAVLMAKADLMEPLLKPMSLLLRMWEYQMFRWATYLLVFFFFTYLLPYYLTHPISLQGLWSLLFGT